MQKKTRQDIWRGELEDGIEMARLLQRLSAMSIQRVSQGSRRHRKVDLYGVTQSC